jgi:hypothetical protein
MADDTAAEPWVVCAPLARVKTMTPDGMQWRDYGRDAHLPGDVDPAHLAMLARKGIVRRPSDPVPVFGWPGTDAQPDATAVQARVIEALDQAGEAKVAQTRAVRRARRGPAVPTPLSAAVSGTPAGDDEHGDSGDGSNSGADDE